ncbi:hypothetical protein FOZ60_011582 [Perkinsus olseni]|uniref:Uncharacterized protein n=1 Tax=Perkinsus olseni TaxID=32597 RepID=A0A7J6ND35_PEROL|nr:hypothetical protein FOZ60_011582 [Perkinsus olseni]
MLHFTVAASILLALSLSGCDDEIHTGSCEFHGETRKESLVVITRDGDVKNGTFHLSSFQCGINPHATTQARDHTQQHTLAELPSESRQNLDKIFAADGPRKAETCRAIAEELRKEASGPAYASLFDNMPATIDRLLDRLCSLVASASVGKKSVTISGGYVTMPDQGYLRNVEPHNGG